MGFGLFFGFFFISHVLPLSVSAEEDSKFTNTTCPESYNCGNLTNSKFPNSKFIILCLLMVHN